LIIVISLSLYGIYRYRIDQLLELQTVRNKISKDLHDDIGSALSSINIYGEVAKQKLGDHNDMREILPILTRITESSANVMENMQNIVWAINPANDGLDNILVRMQVFAAQVLEPQNIQVEFTTEIAEKDIRLGMEKRRDLFLLFKEAINNIAKHSKAGITSIVFRREGKRLIMKIEDNGIGFDRALSLPGNGLRNMAERIQLMGGAIDIQSAPGKGTTIRVTIRI
jgi:signal transduction histidine kinase